MEDRELVRRLLEKDASAEKLFYDTYRSKLHRIATFFLGYKDPDVEDVVQETFLGALKELPGFGFKCTFFHWLRRICVFKSYDRIRQRSRLVMGLDEDLERGLQGKAVERADADAREGERQARLEMLGKARAALDGKCREILELRDVQEKKYGEMAKRLGIPVGTVMSRLARCKEELKRRMLEALAGGEINHG